MEAPGPEFESETFSDDHPLLGYRMNKTRDAASPILKHFNSQASTRWLDVLRVGTGPASLLTCDLNSLTAVPAVEIETTVFRTSVTTVFDCRNELVGRPGGAPHATDSQVSGNGNIDVLLNIHRGLASALM